MIKIYCEQGSEEWYDLRSSRVTGTKFSDLMAKPDTASYRNLVAGICASAFDIDDEGEKFITEDMERGTLLEPEARELYAEMRDVYVEQVGFILPGNEYDDWTGISPDGIMEVGMLEIKCPKLATHLSYIREQKLPTTYKWQIMGQLWVTGAEWCDFMSYYQGLKPFIIRVFPDEVIFKSIEEKLNVLIADVRNTIELYNQYSVS